MEPFLLKIYLTFYLQKKKNQPSEDLFVFQLTQMKFCKVIHNFKYTCKTS